MEDTYKEAIKTFNVRLSIEDDNIKKLEAKLATAIYKKEIAEKSLDLLEKCCTVSENSPYNSLDERDVSDFVLDKLDEIYENAYIKHGRTASV